MFGRYISSLKTRFTYHGTYLT
jgi:hypothetical protein